jgi:sec-independent protein translocase protein TatA
MSEDGLLVLGWPETILILVVLLFVFGPKKLPEIAREIGRAWREFTKASSGVEETVQSPKSQLGGSGEAETLLNIARKLNVNTEGKTLKQIADEIVAKAISKGKETISKEE